MNEIESVYVPLKPNKRKRFGLMVQSVTPAILLILTAVSANSETVGGMLLRVLTLATGFVIIYGSVKDYKSPGSGKWMGLDTSMMFSGMLLIAQGAWMYKPEKGFQPAHMLFIGASVLIFKGVMFPESKVKAGFEINEKTFSFKRLLFSRTVEIPMNEINSFKLTGDKMDVVLHSGKHLTLNLNGFELNPDLVNELNDLVTEFQKENKG
jgi:hypothetical protein